jgi:hypothetical protein
MLRQHYAPPATAALLHPLTAYVQDSLRTQAIVRSSAQNRLDKLMSAFARDRDLIVSYGSLPCRALAKELQAWHERAATRQLPPLPLRKR